jgi:hypothetical protein
VTPASGTSKKGSASLTPNSGKLSDSKTTVNKK